MHRGPSGTDWDLLGEAAAEIARYKIQQQANSRSKSSGGDGWSGRKGVAMLRQWLRFLTDFPSWLQYRCSVTQAMPPVGSVKLLNVWGGEKAGLQFCGSVNGTSRGQK